jgi:acyl carrier protein
MNSVPISITLPPGHDLIVQLSDSSGNLIDGEFKISFDSVSVQIEADLPDSQGREGVIYKEDFNMEGPEQKEIELNKLHVVTSSKNLKRLMKLISQYSDVPEEQMKLESELKKDLGIESLEIIELVLCVEDEFGVHFNDEETSSLVTVQDILSLVEVKHENAR